MLSLLLITTSVWTAFAFEDKFCKATSCLLKTEYNETNGKLNCEAKIVPLDKHRLTVNAWNSTLGVYMKKGHVDAYSYREKEFGLQLHGGKVFPGSNPQSGKMKDIYLAGSGTEAIFRAQNIPEFTHSKTFLNDTAEFTLSKVATALAPSTMEFLQDKNGKYTGMFIAEGNPLVIDQKLNKTADRGFGQLEFMSSEGGQCKSVYPGKTNPMMNEMGVCLNTVECISSLGICFMSGWRFWDQSNTMSKMIPDCLHWCRVDDMAHPTRCLNSGVVKYANGTNVCAEGGNGGVHGLMVLNKGDIKPKKNLVGTQSASVSVLGIFTGGPFWDRGKSEIIKLDINVAISAIGVTTLKTTANTPWATDLWQRTTTEPHDVGLDHCWQDGKGFVWCSSFRRMNNGLHLLSPEGRLMFTIRGFDLSYKYQYTYPSAVNGHGAFLTEGSFMVVSTSNLNTPMWGKSSFFVVDITQMESFYP